jgi:ankyrin repeat protein
MTEGFAMYAKLLSVVIFLIPACVFAADIHDLVKEGELKDVKAKIASDPKLLNAKNTIGATPLSLAALYGRTEIVKWLIETGADANNIEDAFSTPFFLAVYGNDIETAKVLLPKTKVLNPQKNGMTLLHMIAIGQNNAAAIELLIANGVDIEVRNEQGFTPLHTAVSMKSEAAIQTLLKCGANIEAKNLVGSTALQMTALSGDERIANLLIEHRANLNAVSNGGCTPLHFATLGDNKETVRLLLEKGARVSPQDEDGETPLHVAARHGRIEIAKLLREHGADENVKNEDGKTPLDIAKDETMKRVIKQFKKD